MSRFKDQAICIRLADWSETSQIATLLCQTHGKITGMAKGSKRSSPSSVARYSGGFELLTLGQVVAVSKPSAELATLTEWDLQDSFWHLRSDLRSQQLALYAADLTRALLADHDPHPKSFTALHRLLNELASADQREQALLAFQWQLLSDCGVRPQLDHDVRSGQPLAGLNDGNPQTSSAPVYYLFDPRAGGLTSEPAGTGSDGWRVRYSTVAFLKRLSAGQWPPPAGSSDALDSSTAATVERANQLLCVYARSVLDRQLPTMTHILNRPNG